MQQRLHTIRSSQTASRHGFTLTEMLVATGLVLLIMSLFAQIYTTALGTMSEQRGLANNDQKARTVSEVMRKDLDLMTYKSRPGVRGLQPLYPGKVPNSSEERGYFYYSENDPNNDTDDVLQFTVQFPQGPNAIWSDEGDDAAFFGKARALGQQNNRPPYYRNPVNQPYFDGPYGSGRSTAAEVSYFLRNGSLYRRVLLIREPAAHVNNDDVQPEYNNKVKVFNTSNPDYSGVFWRDFDYSVTRVGGVLTFHGLSSLDNVNSGLNPTIAQPWNRFGHHNGGGANNGQPREFDDPTDTAEFFGRTTLQENSSEETSTNGWPSVASNVFNRGATGRTLDPATGVMNGFDTTTATRIGEDILLTNVESFDVKMYDPNAATGAGQFIDIPAASATPTSTDLYTNNWNSNYGPRDSGTSTIPNNVFDTWFRNALTVPPAPPAPRPPRVAWRLLPNSWPPAAPQVWEQRDSMNPYTPADEGKIIFTTDNPFVYYQLANVQDGITGTTEPDWNTFTGDVQDRDPALPSTGVEWRKIDNTLGLEGISITVRFRDVKSSLPRQVTIVHSFVD